MLSIIIPVKNQKEITQVCLDSLRLYTKDGEVILVNDGSDEDTSKFLESMPDVKLITHNISLGWCKSINDGLKEAKGDYVVFSNNDVVFTPNWAEKMLAHFKVDDKLGVLGPVTHKVGGYQSIDFNKKGVDFQYSDALTFFCVMVKREVIDKIGGLDEKFGFGGQDDADYCIRARQAGYKVGIARDVFIYHYGSASFREYLDNDIPASKEYAQSRVNILRDKYRNTPDPAVRKRIFIAIPNQGSIVPGLVQNLIMWTHDPRYVVRLYMPQLFPLDNARNHCVKEFLELDYDYLWWIDDDIVPPLDAMHRLVMANKDIIGATCFSMKSGNGEYFPYPVTLRYNEEKKYVAYYGQGIEEVDATGGACVMFKRKVYEQIERPYEFQYHKDGTLSLTCDFDIHQKAHKLGFKTFIDFGLLCSHIKKCDIKGFQDLMTKVNKDG